MQIILLNFWIDVPSAYTAILEVHSLNKTREFQKYEDRGLSLKGCKLPSFNALQSSVEKCN